MNKKNLWEKIKITFLFFTLIISIIFLHQWWNRKQQLKNLEKQHQNSTEQYQKQQKELAKINSLAKNSNIHQFFTNLLQNSAQKFADSKNIDIASYPLNFGGFYQAKERASNSSAEVKIASLGNATFDEENNQTTIALNQLFLFNKLGYKDYFITPELHQEISFDELIECCCHELAHYLQFAKWRKSSCASDLEINKKSYNLELAEEHQEFTQAIYQLLKNSAEYSVWESEWKEIQC
ncbi:MAG: hypothetical protein LBR43_03060 [Spiroplasmataceae bacterium]|jgi:hypothetical protein|nr:hypothetical protein [Spiroplasmataceae bacterium]